jgi:RecA-family ATPase
MRGAVVEGLAAPGAPVTARRYVPNSDSSDRSGEDRPETQAPLTLLRPVDLAGKEVPERRWIVPNWIPSGVVTGLYGAGGEGKTLLGQQLQTSTALGQFWVGQETEPVRSIGLYCEDGRDELHRRQTDINRYYNCAFEELKDIIWLPRLGDDNMLMVFGSRGRGELTSLHEQIIEAARDHHARLVTIDTVADTFGGNENDRGQVRQYVSRALGSIALAIDGAVVALAHPSRAGLATGDGDSGSTGWSNAFRSRLFLTTPAPDDDAQPDIHARVLQRKKANYASRNDEIKLRWREGVLVVDQPEAGFATTFGRRPVEDVFLSLLDAFTREGQNASESLNAGNYAPRVFCQRADRDGYRVGDFKRAMQTLFSRGAIKVVEYGPPSNLKRKIARVSE